MIPSDYRLEHVAARLVERLEGARRTYAGDDERAAAELRRITDEHVAAAVGEYRAMAVEDPERHASFLRRELTDTLLPRYTRLAIAQTALEASHYGLGRLGEPIGRVVFVAADVLLLVFLSRWLGYRPMWPVFGLALLAPFLPELLELLYARRYRRELEALVGDMARIQDQARVWLTPEQLDAAADRPAPSRGTLPREPIADAPPPSPRRQGTRDGDPS